MCWGPAGELRRRAWGAGLTPIVPIFLVTELPVYESQLDGDHLGHFGSGVAGVGEDGQVHVDGVHAEYF